jgi:hypothetical protein
VALENFGAREIAVWAQIDAKKSVRKLNKVKFQGFLGVCDFTFFTARAGERFKKVTRIWSDMVGWGFTGEGESDCTTRLVADEQGL